MSNETMRILWKCGVLSIGRLTIWQRRCAMHFALSFWTNRWGYVCFHPPMYVFGSWWPWYFYVSPNGTPWASTYAVGPGIQSIEKEYAPLRRARYGHNYSTKDLVRFPNGAWL